MKLRQKTLGGGAIAALCVLLAGCGPGVDELYSRAEQSLAAGDARAAVIDLKNVVEKQPQNANARALLARALIATFDVEAGRIELQKAKDLGADATLLLLPECQSKVYGGQFEQALAECRHDAAPAALKAHMAVVEGNAQLGLGRPADAMKAFEFALTQAPDSIDAALGKVAATQKLEGPAAAAAFLGQAPDALHRFPRYWIALASLGSATGDLPGAEANFRKALAKLDEKNDPRERMIALGGLAEVQLMSGNVAAAAATSEALAKLAPKHPMAMQLRARALAADGKYDEARALLEKLTADNPDNYEARLLLGIVNAEQGNLDQAEMHLAAVVAHDPQNARAYRLLADVRARLGHPGDMLQEVRAALRPDGNDPSMLVMAGQLSLVAGEREQALAYLAKAGEQGSDAGPEAQLEIANGYLVAGETDRALEILESIEGKGVVGAQRDALLLATLLRQGDEARLLKEAARVLEQSGSDPVVRNMVGGVYAAAGKTQLAREQFDAVLKQAPRNAQARMNLARLALAEKDTAAAAVQFTKVLEVDPKNLGATLGAAMVADLRKDTAEATRLLLKATGDHPDSVEAHLALAQQYLGQGHADKARSLLDAAIERNPRSAAMVNGRGLVMLQVGDAPGAIASFEKAVALEPRRPDLALNLARAKLANRDAKGALAVLDETLQASPKYLPAMAMGVVASVQAGDAERATGYVERARKAAPGSPFVAQLEGDLAMSQSRYRDALAAYQKSDPAERNRDVTLARFTAAARAGLPEADAILSRWVQAHPQDMDAVVRLAEYKRERGNVKAAVAAYERGLQHQPDAIVLNNNLAMLLDGMGDARALQYAEKAYKAAPKAAAIADTYGWILLRAGKTGEALELLRDAAQRIPDNAEVQYHYAAALAQAGRKADARPILQKAVAGQLPTTARAHAQKLLEDLSK